MHFSTSNSIFWKYLNIWEARLRPRGLHYAWLSWALFSIPNISEDFRRRAAVEEGEKAVTMATRTSQNPWSTPLNSPFLVSGGLTWFSLPFNSESFSLSLASPHTHIHRIAFFLLMRYRKCFNIFIVSSSFTYNFQELGNNIPYKLISFVNDTEFHVKWKLLPWHLLPCSWVGIESRRSGTEFLNYEEDSRRKFCFYLREILTLCNMWNNYLLNWKTIEIYRISKKIQNVDLFLCITNAKT